MLNFGAFIVYSVLRCFPLLNQGRRDPRILESKQAPAGHLLSNRQWPEATKQVHSLDFVFPYNYIFIELFSRGIRQWVLYRNCFCSLSLYHRLSPHFLWPKDVSCDEPKANFGAQLNAFLSGQRGTRYGTGYCAITEVHRQESARTDQCREVHQVSAGINKYQQVQVDSIEKFQDLNKHLYNLSLCWFWIWSHFICTLTLVATLTATLTLSCLTFLDGTFDGTFDGIFDGTFDGMWLTVQSSAVRWQLVSRIADNLSATGDPRSAYAFGCTCGAFDGARAVRSGCLGAVRRETSSASALGQKMTSAIKACLLTRNL